jgi:uncharacterized protein involved in exopolysaccharide biosynthesis
MDEQQDDEISLLDLVEPLVERIWLLILGPLFTGILALAVSFLTPPTFTAKTVLMPPPGSAERSSLAAPESWGLRRRRWRCCRGAKPQRPDGGAY